MNQGHIEAVRNRDVSLWFQWLEDGRKPAVFDAALATFRFGLPNGKEVDAIALTSDSPVSSFKLSIDSADFNYYPGTYEYEVSVESKFGAAARFYKTIEKGMFVIAEESPA